MSIDFKDWRYMVDEIQKRYGFDEEHAENAANRLNYVPEIFNDFLTYLRTGDMPNTEKGGHTSHELVEKYELLPIGAYLMLFELATNPQQGEEYLTKIREEGHHTPKYDEKGNLVEIEFTTIETGDEAQTCPKCGKPATWIEQYQRWYCYECEEYL